MHSTPLPSTLQSSTIEPATAIHEAGHAVAYLLTARAMGRQCEHAVYKIELISRADEDGNARVAAMCWAPMVSSKIDSIIVRSVDHRTATANDIWQAIIALADRGELARSMRMRMLVSMMGPAADARYRGEDSAIRLDNASCHPDREAFARDSAILGLKPHEVDGIRARYLDAASELVARPAVWAAIEALASGLRSSMSGKRVAALAWPKLKDDLAAIALAEAVVTEGPDGSTAHSARQTHDIGPLI